MPTEEPTPEHTPFSKVRKLTIEEVRPLIEGANAALAPFLGEGAVECGQEGWLLLEGYSSKGELLTNMKPIFEDWLAKNFYYRYEELLLKEEDGRVYVRSDSRDLLGHYYDMDLDTLEFFFEQGEEDYLVDNPYFPSYYGCSAKGFGNGTDVIWSFGLGWEEDDLQIDFYGCDDGTFDDFAILPGGRPYSVNDKGSPQWMGEPGLVEEGIDERWGESCWHWRRESYPGFTVLMEYDSTIDEEYTAHYITVDGPGVPTDRGIGIGATLKEFLTAYPQFNMAADTMNRLAEGKELVYARRYPLTFGDWAPSCPGMDFLFDEDLVLKRIYLHYSESN